MEQLKYNCKDDIGKSGVYPASQDWKQALGEWFNYDVNTGQIARVRVTESGGKLWMESFGACAPEPCPWGIAEVQTFTTKVDSAEIEGFTGKYDFGFKETEFCTLFKYGTLVIQTYHHFKDGSGRCDYFTREFFHLNLD